MSYENLRIGPAELVELNRLSLDERTVQVLVLLDRFPPVAKYIAPHVHAVTGTTRAQIKELVKNCFIRVNGNRAELSPCGTVVLDYLRDKRAKRTLKSGLKRAKHAPANCNVSVGGKEPARRIPSRTP